MSWKNNRVCDEKKKKVGRFFEKRGLRNPNTFATVVQVFRLMLDSASDMTKKAATSLCGKTAYDIKWVSATEWSEMQSCLLVFGLEHIKLS